MFIGFKQKSIYYIGLFLVSFGFWLLADGAKAEPAIEIAPDHFDFGSVPPGSTLEYVGWIRSVGSDSLKIDEIKTGCACVAGLLAPVVLAPGDSVGIELTWRFRDSSESVTSYIFCNTRDGIARLNLLAVSQESKNEDQVRISPERIRIDSVVTPGPKREIRIKNGLDETVRLKVVSAGQKLELDAPDSVSAKSVGVLGIKLAPEIGTEPLETSITLELIGDSGFRKRVSIPIEVNIRTIRALDSRTLNNR